MGASISWDEKDIEFLKENYPKQGITFCVENGRLSEKDCYRIIKQKGFKKRDPFPKENHKICSRCEKEKPFKEYQFKKGAKFGIHPACRKCCAIIDAESRNKNSEYIKRKKKEYYWSNRERIRKEQNSKRIKIGLKNAWTEDQILALKGNLDKGIDELVALVGRDSKSVMKKITRFGLSYTNNRYSWAEEDINTLKTQYGKGVSFLEKKLNKCKPVIHKKAQELGIILTNPNQIFWDDNKIDFLIKNYPIYGKRYCQKHLGCGSKRIKKKVVELGLKSIRDFSVKKIRPQRDLNKKKKKTFKIKGVLSPNEHKAYKNYFHLKCHKKRYYSDPGYRLMKIARGRFKELFKKKSFSDKKEEIIGCSPKELKEHIEAQFQEGMDWNNYGKRAWWVVDHILPVNLLKELRNIDKTNLIFNYRNLQPLEVHINRDKWDYLEGSETYLQKKIAKFGHDPIYQQLLDFLHYEIRRQNTPPIKELLENIQDYPSIGSV